MASWWNRPSQGATRRREGCWAWKTGNTARGTAVWASRAVHDLQFHGATLLTNAIGSSPSWRVINGSISEGRRAVPALWRCCWTHHLPHGGNPCTAATSRLFLCIHIRRNRAGGGRPSESSSRAEAARLQSPHAGLCILIRWMEAISCSCTEAIGPGRKLQNTMRQGWRAQGGRGRGKVSQHLPTDCKNPSRSRAYGRRSGNGEPGGPWGHGHMTQQLAWALAAPRGWKPMTVQAGFGWLPRKNDSSRGFLCLVWWRYLTCTPPSAPTGPGRLIATSGSPSRSPRPATP